jgi:hypothetical protein
MLSVGCKLALMSKEKSVVVSLLWVYSFFFSPLACVLPYFSQSCMLIYTSGKSNYRLPSIQIVANC